MRRMLVTTVSIIAFGLGGIGLAGATGSTVNKGLSGSSTPPAASTTQSKNTNAMTTHRATRMGRGEVIQMQRKLRAEGLYKGRIDGRLGPETRIALRHSQQQTGSTMGQGSSRMPTTHHRLTGKASSKLQNASQPGQNTMGQGSSGEPPTNATQMTPPTTPSTGSTSTQGQDTGTGTGTQGTQNNQK